MYLVGIDPGWRNFAFFVAEVSENSWKELAWENIDMLPTRKHYNFQAMKCSIAKWYQKNGEMLQKAKVIIERQPFARFQNIVGILQALIPHAELLDTKCLKTYFNIGTGRHYTNKKAIVRLGKHLIPAEKHFKILHNKLDSWILVYYYAVVILKINLPPLIDLTSTNSK